MSTNCASGVNHHTNPDAGGGRPRKPKEYPPSHVKRGLSGTTRAEARTRETLGRNLETIGEIPARPVLGTLLERDPEAGTNLNALPRQKSPTPAASS